MQEVCAVAPSLEDGWVLWEIAGKPVSVRLSRDVAGRLGIAVREGFRALRRRGLETGGLLLGSAREAGTQIVVEVRDFEPVECEHVTGPSYQLSETDCRVLEARIAAHAAGGDDSIVGFYRSHTRPDFAITEEDAAIFASYFPKASDVFLLIKSNEGAPPTGGFIIREGGEILTNTPYDEFPFYTFTGTPAARERAATVPESLPSPRVPQLPAFQSVRRTKKRPGSMALVIATALAAGVLLGIEAGLPGPRPPGPGPSLGLRVTNSGDGLRLSWNHLASQRAGAGILYIRDGNEEKQYGLDVKQLSEGSIAYWPANADVNFRLELIAAGLRVTESVRAIGGPSKTPSLEFPADSSPTPPVAKPAQAAKPVQAAKPLQAAKPAARATTQAKRPRTFAVPPSRHKSPTVLSASLPDPPPPQPLAVPPPAKVTSAVERPDPSFHVVAEPVSGSRLEHLASNIPLIGRRYRHSDYVPPAPLKHPVVADPPDQDLAQEVKIDVKVYINPAGRVDYSELISKVPEQHRGLAQFAIFSARRWEFVPARAAGSAVQSAMILHYQFVPR